MCSYQMVKLTNKDSYCYIQPLSLPEGVYFVMGEAWTPEYPTMQAFYRNFINMTTAPVTAAMTERSRCVHTLGLKSYLNGTGSYDANLFRSGRITLPQSLLHTCDISMKAYANADCTSLCACVCSYIYDCVGCVY
jgi:hypothetical protein